MFNPVTLLLMHESGHSEGTVLNLNDNARKGGIPSCTFSGFRRVTAPVPVSLRGVSCPSAGGSTHSWGTLHLGPVGSCCSSRHPDRCLPSSSRSWVSTAHKWPIAQRNVRSNPVSYDKKMRPEVVGRWLKHLYGHDGWSSVATEFQVARVR